MRKMLIGSDSSVLDCRCPTAVSLFPFQQRFSQEVELMLGLS